MTARLPEITLTESGVRDLVDGLDAIVWEADAEPLRFTFVSEAAERILGYPAAQWLEDPATWANMLHPDDRDRSVAFCVEATHEGRDHEFTYRAIAADGRVVWLHDVVRVVRDHDGRPARLRGVMLDITARKEAEAALKDREAQLRQVQKLEAVGKLAGGIAHDFNNLLTVIRSYSELLLQDLPDGDPKRGDVTEIRGAAERAAQLTRQLLAFSRRQVLQPVVLDLNALVADMKRLLARLIRENVHIDAAPMSTPAHVLADPVQLQQVLIHLAMNASEAMPNGGTLTIATELVTFDEQQAGAVGPLRAGPHVVLRVSDTGHGMDAETQTHIFEPFFTTKRRGQGTGLSLSMVLGIVEQSGGVVRFESEPDQGTTFRIYLPLIEEGVTPGSAPTRASEVGGTETVLLAEDEAAVRAITSRTLSALGYTVLTARDGADALALSRRHGGAIDLLLTDVVMPVMGGAELASHLTAERPGLQVIYMSGYADDELVRRAMSDPAIAFLAKPFDGRVLARKVRDVLDAATPRGQSV
ncbi:MAG TPA: ATP-binding protein [Gemmatimonadaceae bacterium]|nr:ATP-binding protein [Gemmatimonadaceae bacterium]